MQQQNGFFSELFNIKTEKGNALNTTIRALLGVREEIKDVGGIVKFVLDKNMFNVNIWSK